MTEVLPRPDQLETFRPYVETDLQKHGLRSVRYLSDERSQFAGIRFAIADAMAEDVGMTVQNGMTVQKLIELLTKFPKDALVLVQGYEDGFSDIDLKQSLIRQNQNRQSWSGPHEEVESGGEPAVLILRRENEIAED